MLNFLGCQFPLASLRMTATTNPGRRARGEEDFLTRKIHRLEFLMILKASGHACHLAVGASTTLTFMYLFCCLVYTNENT
ncbi:hypothetical protein OUZ56_025067 [Daphnia magna]|uniref:Uncharacterized protein n=1 Tax=Daphnia magna TaxID=35525 RepID=A0ABQ9ZIR4_9CRUS|nr:hypothetical protein OUZ56_025067 [Daphnia magna]